MVFRKLELSLSKIPDTVCLGGWLNSAPFFNLCKTPNSQYCSVFHLRLKDCDRVDDSTMVNDKKSFPVRPH